MFDLNDVLDPELLAAEIAKELLGASGGDPAEARRLLLLISPRWTEAAGRALQRMVETPAFRRGALRRCQRIKRSFPRPISN